MAYRDALHARSEITRKTSRHVLPVVVLIALVSLGCVVAIVMALGAVDPFVPGLAALACGAAAVGLGFGLQGGVGSAPCPACGALLDGLDRRARVEGVLCHKCHRFLEGESGRIWVTAPSTIADVPIFGATLPDDFQLPPGCVVCGKDPSQHLPITIGKDYSVPEIDASKAIGMVVAGAVAGVLLVPRLGKTVSLGVPHCADHNDGAIAAKGGPTEYMIFFRSYPYQQKFCELNKAIPMEGTAAGRSNVLTRLLPSSSSGSESA